MIVEAKSISKRLGETRAIDGLSFVLTDGIVGLVGKNGAGKSTLLRCLAGVYQLDAGELLCDGVPIGLSRPAEGTFFLPDDPYCPKGLSLKGLYRFLSCHYALDYSAIRDMAMEFGLPTDKPISSFSKGMKRQAYLAAALSVDSRLLLLDEAFDGLDPLALEKIKSRIVERFVGKDKLVVIASHNIVSLERLSDTFLLIDKGRLSEKGASEEIAHGLTKIQAVFSVPVSESDIESLGIDVIGFRSQGAMAEFLTHDESSIDKLKGRFAPPYIEKVPLTSTEIIAHAMAEGEKHE